MRVIYSANGLTSLTGLDWRLVPDGAARTIADPDPFVSFVAVDEGDDRRTPGGVRYFRRKFTGWRAQFGWSLLTQAEADALATFWSTTAGWRTPFAVCEGTGVAGEVAYLGTMIAGVFPLSHVGGNPARYSTDVAVAFEATQRLVLT